MAIATTKRALAEFEDRQNHADCRKDAQALPGHRRHSAGRQGQVGQNQPEIGKNRHPTRIKATKPFLINLPQSHRACDNFETLKSFSIESLLSRRDLEAWVEGGPGGALEGRLLSAPEKKHFRLFA